MECTIISTTPTAMESANKQMIIWTKAKAHDVQLELKVLREELKIAKRNKWTVSGIQRRLKREGKRLHFYSKIGKALKAGYYVVPNMPADVFAIRTDAKGARKHKVYGYVGWSTFKQPLKMLPEGEGRYVGPTASYQCTGMEPRGCDDTMTNVFESTDLKSVDFPIALMKPEAMEATGKAMALKIFDEVLECRDAMGCGDPMVLGRIRNPRTARPDMTFFIASVMPLDRI